MSSSIKYPIDTEDASQLKQLTSQSIKEKLKEFELLGVKINEKIVDGKENISFESELLCFSFFPGVNDVESDDFIDDAAIFIMFDQNGSQLQIYERFWDGSGFVAPLAESYSLEELKRLIIAVILNMLDAVLNEKFYYGIRKHKAYVIYPLMEGYYKTKKSRFIQTSSRVKDLDSFLLNGNFKTITTDDLKKPFVKEKNEMD